MPPELPSAANIDRSGGANHAAPLVQGLGSRTPCTATFNPKLRRDDTYFGEGAGREQILLWRRTLRVNRLLSCFVFRRSFTPVAFCRIRAARVVLVVGTSSLVYPAAALPQIAKASGAYVVEVNPEPTPLSAEVDERLAGPAGAIVPALAEAAVPGPG